MIKPGGHQPVHEGNTVRSIATTDALLLSRLTVKVVPCGGVIVLCLLVDIVTGGLFALVP